jgi:hypothetical protein
MEREKWESRSGCDYLDKVRRFGLERLRDGIELAKRGAEMGLKQEKANRVRFNRRNSMKTKLTRESQGARLGVEEWKESNKEECGGGWLLDRTEVLVRRMEQCTREERGNGTQVKEVVLDVKRVVSAEEEIEGGEDLPKSLSALKQA